MILYILKNWLCLGLFFCQLLAVSFKQLDFRKGLSVILQIRKLGLFVIFLFCCRVHLSCGAGSDTQRRLEARVPLNWVRLGSFWAAPDLRLEALGFRG